MRNNLEAPSYTIQQLKGWNKTKGHATNPGVKTGSSEEREGTKVIAYIRETTTYEPHVI